VGLRPLVGLACFIAGYCLAGFVWRTESRWLKFIIVFFTADDDVFDATLTSLARAEGRLA